MSPQLKIGDPIRIQLHGHEQVVEGKIVGLLPDQHVKAEITEAHPLAMLDSEHKRVLIVSPDMYETALSPEPTESA